jgi:hypothetical protein
MRRKTTAQKLFPIAAVPGLTALCLLAVTGTLSAREGAEWAWPLEGQPAVSSNFCEYREGHFHAGLDIRSYGAEGVPCVAVGDGYVSRLRASSEGYGKALYLRLDSGETAVYAHVAEFDSSLEEALYAAQLRAGRYAVDIRFPRGRFPVGRGDVIAWSGSTGGTDPHLHFEIRDKGENPLNPFSSGFALEDRLPAVFERVQFSPLGPRARINGHCWPAEVVAYRLGEGRFAIPDTLTLSGGVGVAVEVYDRLNRRSGRLAPYRIALAVDDTVVADITLKRFSFSHTDQVDFLYDIARVRRERAYVVQLFASGGESMWNRRFRRGGALGYERAGDGGGEPAPDIRRGVVTATDAAGNAATLVFHFRPGAVRARPLATDGGENTPVRTDSAVPGFYFRGGFVSADHPIPGALTGGGEAFPSDRAGRESIEGQRPPIVYTARDLVDGPIPAPVRLGADSATAYLIGIEHGTPTSVNFADLGLQLVLGKRTLYADAVLFAMRWSDDGTATNDGELIRRSAPVLIGPYAATLQADMEIRFHAPGSFDSTSAVYRLNERKGEWVFYETAADASSVRTTARRPGVYCVLADRYGPRVRRPFVRAHESYATGRRWPMIVVPIEDTGSGVDHRKTAVSLDGVEQIAYWDSKAKKMFVVVRDANIMGPRSLSVVAYDNIGNRSRLDATVDLRVNSPSREKN